MYTEGEVIQLSAHKINMVMNCTFKYFLYDTKRSCPIEEIKYISTGQAVHKYMEDLSDGDTKSREYYLNADYLEEGMWDYERKNTYIVPEEMYERFDICVENGTNWYGGRIFEIETSFNKKFMTPKGREVELRGRIDAQDEEEVIDWKTGSKVKSNPEYIRQAHIYDFATDFKKKVKFVSLLTPNEILEIRHSRDYVPKLCDEAIDRMLELPLRRDDRHSNYMCTNFCENYKTFCLPGKEFIQME